MRKINYKDRLAPQEPVLPPFARDEASDMIHMMITRCDAVGCSMPTENVLWFPKEKEHFQCCCIHFREWQEKGLFRIANKEHAS